MLSGRHVVGPCGLSVAGAADLGFHSRSGSIVRSGGSGIFFSFCFFYVGGATTWDVLATELRSRVRKEREVGFSLFTSLKLVELLYSCFDWG